MKQYYLEKFEQATLKLKLARIGYEREMGNLAWKLANSVDTMHGPIIEEITKMQRALDEMVAEAKEYKAKYQAECEKEDKNVQNG